MGLPEDFRIHHFFSQSAWDSLRPQLQYHLLGDFLTMILISHPTPAGLLITRPITPFHPGICICRPLTYFLFTGFLSISPRYRGNSSVLITHLFQASRKITCHSIFYYMLHSLEYK